MLSDLNSEAIFYSHKFRQSLPDKAAMAIAAKQEMDKIKNYLIDIQNGSIEDRNGNIDKTIDKFISIVSDISVFSKNGFRTPVMRSEEYRSIVDATTIVSKTDSYGNITYVNNYFCRISGYTTEELLGKSHNIIRHPDMPKEVFKEMWETISGEKKVWRGEILNLSKDKKEYWVDATIIPQIDIETKEIIGYAAFRYDITEKVRQRQLIEHEQQLNQMILDGWTGIVIIVDKNGGLIKANKAFFEAFKISSIKQFNSIHDSIFDLLGCRKIFEQNNEKELRHKTVFVDDNQKKVFMLTAKATYSDKSYVISMNDITEAENDIQTAKKESFAKSSFLANMSHEIRTPINGITGFVELLSQTKLDTQQNEYVTIVKNSAKTLLGVINDILDFSKIEAGSFEIEKIDFNPIKEIESIAELFVAKATEQNINLCVFVDPNLPTCTLGDPLRLKQIIANLIGNAIKFTPKNGEVSIFAEALQGEDEGVARVKISIVDTGAGMSPETQKLIFTPFTQADNTISRKYGGTGLGLTICQNLANLMGSNIEFKSELGKGSEFWFVIDLEICNTQTAADLLTMRDKEVAIYIAHTAQAKCAYILKRYLEAFNFKYEFIDNVDEIPSANCDILMIISGGKDQIEQIDTRYLQTHRVISIIPAGVTDKNRFSSHQTISMPINGSKIFDVIMDSKSKLISSMTSINNDTKKEQYAAKVLVAEDNTTNQKLAIYLLGRFGIIPTIANNGEEAFEYFKTAYRNNASYDLIFMDVHMPVLDGMDSTREIRAFEKDLKLKKTPIVALTADVIKGQEQKYHEAGMDSFLSKPIDFDKFDAKITEFLSHTKIKHSDQKNIEQTSRQQDDNGSGDVQSNSVIIQTRAAFIAERLDLDIETATILVVDFHDNWARQSKELEDAIQNNEIEIIRSVSHSIKGAAGSLRLDAIYDICVNIENAAKDNSNTIDYNERFNDLKSAIDS